MKKRDLLKSFSALLLAAALLVTMVPMGVSAASSDEIRDEIDALEEEQAALEKKIEEIQSQYQANENEILDMVSQKNVIDQEIAVLNEKTDLINEQIRAYSLLIADKQEELETAQVRLDELQEQYKERIRAMEEEGEVSYWSVLFRASSFADFLAKLTMIEDIAEADQRRLQELNAAAEVVAKAQAELETGKRELEDARTELEANQQLLDQKRAEANEILTELVARGEEIQALLDESEALQDELMQEIAAKEKELKDAEYQEWLREQAVNGAAPESNAAWRRPLNSYVLTSPFGMRDHPILGYPRMHNGVDMAAPQGTPIYATRSGKVTTASYQAGGAGYYVSINHGDGFASIYMHMTNYVVSAGQYVEQGQVIGYVGNTGLSKGAHLHFGISYNGTYVNPMAYI